MKQQVRRTKILTTLGPSTDVDDVLKRMIIAGVDMVRMNFSHGLTKSHQDRVTKVRQLTQELDKEVGILADLQGPKIRIARFQDDEITLTQNEPFILDIELADDAGTVASVGVTYKNLIHDVHAGDLLLLDDGRLELQVERVVGAKIHCRVRVGGRLSNNKGINRLGGGLTAQAITEKDQEDLKTAVEIGVDYIAISFPRDANDVEYAKKLIKAAGGSQQVIAKIERTEAVEHLEEIIHASAGVMVARGDLGVEIGDAEVPAVQKRIIHLARNLDKPVITATQMMESMIHNSIPTRAEVSDVANAVLDGTDAVMLSAETATGDAPVQVVHAMSRICLGAEKHRVAIRSHHRVDRQFQRADEAVAMAAMYMANHLNIKCIISLTESGSTPLWMSRIRSGIPIYALSRHVSTRRRVTLYRGVYPIEFDVTDCTRDDVNIRAVQVMLDRELVSKGDLVILTKGDLQGIHGGTNALKIIQI